MAHSRFRMVDYEQALDQTVTIKEVLPPDHLARFIVQVIVMLDLSAIYAGYAPVGGVAYEPELLLGLLVYPKSLSCLPKCWLSRTSWEC